MRATEEGVEVGVVEDGIILGGEEEVTIDEVLLMSEMLEEYSKVFPANHNLVTVKRGGVLNHTVSDLR